MFPRGGGRRPMQFGRNTGRGEYNAPPPTTPTALHDRGSYDANATPLDCVAYAHALGNDFSRGVVNADGIANANTWAGGAEEEEASVRIVPDRSDEPYLPPPPGNKTFWDFLPEEDLDMRNPNLQATLQRAVLCIKATIRIMNAQVVWISWAQTKIDSTIEAARALSDHAKKMHTKALLAETALAIAHPEASSADLEDCLHAWEPNAALDRAKEDTMAGRPPLGTQVMLKVYHDAMVATAVATRDPPYTMPFGWTLSSDGDKFVPNPEHPYWKGWVLAEWLLRTDALNSPGGYWEGAWTRMPGSGGVSLLNPHTTPGNSCIDSRSYWAGIRHCVQGLRGNYDGLPFQKLPKDLEHFAQHHLAQ